jgi:glycosyltransferase involved in cell wall biosynthesis
MTVTSQSWLDVSRRQSQALAPQKSFRALKICFVLEPLHAGVGRHVVDVARDLADRGHEIHILYSPVRLEPQFLADLTRHPRIRCHAIKMMPGLCAGDALAFWRVKEYVKTNGPFDVIHGESSKGGGFARLLKLFGAKTVLYSPHAFVTLSPLLPFAKRWVFKNIEALLSHLTDVIVCSSQSEREHAIGLGISPQKLAVIVNGRAPAQVRDRASIRADLGFAAENVVIGFAGRLEAQKAPQRLIDACRRLLPQLPQLRLLVIGDGTQRGKLEASLREAALEDRVTWLGAVDAVQYMPAMDILAIPSMYEGFPYVLLEALHAGLPVVSTPVGGVKEGIIPGRNGIIVPHHPLEPLVAALRQLGLDANLRQKMAQASREHAVFFSVPRLVDTLESLYLEFATAEERAAKLGAIEYPTSAASAGSI